MHLTFRKLSVIILLKFNSYVPVDVICTDFAKAFDTVSHQELLYKLQNLGITGILYLNGFKTSYIG